MGIPCVGWTLKKPEHLVSNKQNLTRVMKASQTYLNSLPPTQKCLDSGLCMIAKSMRSVSLDCENDYFETWRKRLKQDLYEVEKWIWKLGLSFGIFFHLFPFPSFLLLCCFLATISALQFCVLCKRFCLVLNIVCTIINCLYFGTSSVCVLA